MFQKHVCVAQLVVVTDNGNELIYKFFFVSWIW